MGYGFNAHLMDVVSFKDEAWNIVRVYQATSAIDLRNEFGTEVRVEAPHEGVSFMACPHHGDKHCGRLGCPLCDEAYQEPSDVEVVI